MHLNKTSSYDQECLAYSKSERLFSQLLFLSIQKNQEEKHHKDAQLQFYMRKISDLPEKTLNQIECSSNLK